MLEWWKTFGKYSCFDCKLDAMEDVLGFTGVWMEIWREFNYFKIKKTKFKTKLNN